MDGSAAAPAPRMRRHSNWAAFSRSSAPQSARDWCGPTKRNPRSSRERSLSDAEVAKIWLSAPDNDYGRILKLILLTNCRRAEVGDLKWSVVDNRDRHTITLPRERTKNGQANIGHGAGHLEGRLGPRPRICFWPNGGRGLFRLVEV